MEQHCRAHMPRRPSRVRRGAIFVVALAVLSGFALPQASAVFAGRNGRIAYTRYVAFPSGPDIFTVKPDGTGVVRLTRDGLSSHPRWSPSGKLIAFQRGTSDGVTFSGDLYVMNADGTGVRRVTTGTNGQQPAWSPKGDQLALVEQSGDNSDVFRVPVAGGAVTQLTHAAASGCSANHPSWRSNLIAYHRRCSFTSPTRDEIRVLNLTTGHSRVVLAADPATEYVDWPDFTADLKIMFLGCLQRADQSCVDTANVQVINRDGTGLVALTASSGVAGDPVYRTPVPSPDGAGFAVVESTGNAADQVYCLETPTVHLVCGKGSTEIFEPDWQRLSA